MPMDRFLIAPLNTGLQTDLRPWLIMDDAFERLENAYVFRGRVRKRFGGSLMGSGWTTPATAQLFSRFRIQVGTIGAPVSPVPGAIFKPGQAFSVGTIIFTVSVLGTPGIMINTGPGVNIGTTDGAGNAAGIVPGAVGFVGEKFIIGSQVFTVVTAGAAAMSTSGPGTGTFNTGTGAYTITGSFPNTAIFFYAAAGTYNTTTGAFVISGTGLGAGTPIWFYPAEPVMGLTTYDIGSVNNFPTYGFDTQFAYVFAGGFWQRSGTALWHDPTGAKENYFWSANWSGLSQNLAAYNRALFTTNFQVTNPNGAPVGTDDPIKYFDGTTWNNFIAYFAPAGGAPATGPFVQTSRIIVGFKNRLVLLNTIETNAGANINYQFRARFSWNGSPFATNAWYEKNQTDNTGLKSGGANYVDASTEEAIISAEFIKDRLIVYFERSTWELAYSGNEVLPFLWQKINTELGTESTFSPVPFDREILSIGNTGVHACNGANVQRIDTKIPQFIFEIVDKSTGTQRVSGIRDYFAEMVYWTFPSVTQNPNETFPTKILVYNYQNQSWAVFDDCITTWGYFEQQTTQTWASSLNTWEESLQAWAAGDMQAQFRQVIAGNQQGFVFIADPDISRNAPVMQITNITPSGQGTLITIIDHTLTSLSYSTVDNTGDYICIENAQGITGLNDKIFAVTFITINTVYIDGTFTGTYTGGGTATRVSIINILSKQWNPYVGQGRDFHLAKIDFAVERTENGEITVDYLPNDSEVSMINSGVYTDAIMGNNVLTTAPYDPVIYPFERFQRRLWHSVYFQTTGECIQIAMQMQHGQMIVPAISWSDFQLEGLVLNTRPTSSRLE